MKTLFKISGLFYLGLFLLSCHKDEPILPSVVTTAVTEITYTTAKSGGNVTNEGSAPVTSRGVCWNTSNLPTVDNNKTVETGGLGTFSSDITQLSPNTTYFIRAYATNIDGTGYGDQIQFTTNAAAIPTLTTTEITNITSYSAVSGGNITSENGSTITIRGVCWSTSSNPTLSNDTTNDGNGLGIFTSNISDLLPNTEYYVRSYATNGIGTAYGNEINFTTNPVKVTGISLDLTSVEIVRGNSIQLNATIYPVDATNKNIIWSSSNNSVATVENGLVTGISSSYIGNIIITATTEDGSFYATCEVTVLPVKVTSIILMKDVFTTSPSAVYLLEGENYSLIAEVLPVDADNQNISWSNSNQNIVSTVTYSKYCDITALNLGSAEIVASSEDGSNISSHCTINVVPITEVISLQFESSGLVIINGFVTGDIYSYITNNSVSSDILLTKFEIIDSNTNQVKALTTDPSLLGELYAGQTKNLGAKLNSVYWPIFKWYFTYKDQEYSVQHTFGI